MRRRSQPARSAWFKDDFVDEELAVGIDRLEPSDAAGAKHPQMLAGDIASLEESVSILRKLEP
jgi:hypothetical protein